MSGTMGGTAGAYRGQDRRGVLAPEGRIATLVLVAAAAVACAWLGLMTTGPRLARLLDVHAVAAQLAAVAVVLAVIMGVLCVLRWWMTGDASALWMGTSAIVLGIVVIAVGEHAGPSLLLAWARPAGSAVAAALLIQALRSPDIDARLRPVPLLASALGAVAVLSMVAWTLSPAPPVPTGLWVAGAAWAALAAAFLIAALRRRQRLLAWFSVLLGALALAELARTLADGPASVWVLHAEVARVIALLVGVTGATRALQAAFASQRRRLLQTQIRTLATQARARAEQAASAERAHEARNALTAIEGATLTLERYRDALDPETRAQLAAAVSTEVARLQRLVSDERAAGARVPFRLAETIEPQLDLARRRGVDVVADVPGDLEALGRPADTAEVIHHLLQNASAPVIIQAWTEPDAIVVWIEDPTARAGLAAEVSAELMREQGGSLEVEEQPGGGALYTLRLPPAHTAGPAAPAAPLLARAAR